MRPSFRLFKSSGHIALYESIYLLSSNSGRQGSATGCLQPQWGNTWLGPGQSQYQIPGGIDCRHKLPRLQVPAIPISWLQPGADDSNLIPGNETIGIQS
jgi:hypothetical protein